MESSKAFKSLALNKTEKAFSQRLWVSFSKEIETSKEGFFSKWQSRNFSLLCKSKRKVPQRRISAIPGPRGCAYSRSKIHFSHGLYLRTSWDPRAIFEFLSHTDQPERARRGPVPNSTWWSLPSAAQCQSLVKHQTGKFSCFVIGTENPIFQTVLKSKILV